MSSDAIRRESMSAIRDGMQVIDVDGDTVGTVREVRFADPDAVTPEGQDVGYGGAGDDLPEGARDRLLRTGYVRIHCRGLFKGDCFAEPGDVDRVEDDVVHLSVTDKQLTH